MTQAHPPRVLLGHIAAASGIKGEVVVHVLTSEPEAIGAYGPLMDDEGKRTFELKVVRISARGVICRIAGVSDRNAAEALRGIKLYVARDRLPPPAEDEFYHADLIGLAAEDEKGKPFGHVVAIQNFGADDLIEIRLHGTSRTELYPFTRACVPTIDVVGGRIVIVPPLETDDDREAEEDRAGRE